MSILYWFRKLYTTKNTQGSILNKYKESLYKVQADK